MCFFARFTDDHTGRHQCLYSYAVLGSHNEPTVFTSPNLRVLIHGHRRYLTLNSLAAKKIARFEIAVYFQKKHFTDSLVFESRFQ